MLTSSRSSDRSDRYLTVLAIGFLVVVVVQAATSVAKNIADQQFIGFAIDLVVVTVGVTVIDFVRRLTGRSS